MMKNYKVVPALGTFGFRQVKKLAIIGVFTYKFVPTPASALLLRLFLRPFVRGEPPLDESGLFGWSTMIIMVRFFTKIFGTRLLPW